MRHEPECIHKPENIDSAKGIRWGGSPCICDELRACKQRALDAAREAVAALDVGRDVRFSVDVQADALAAIDALMESK